MSERRVAQILEEWRRLERRLGAETPQTVEHLHVRARIGELRAEYQRLTARADSAQPVPVES
jgi:hypothetical protein